MCFCDNVKSLSCSLTLLATGEEQCKRMEDTFTEFSKQLRALKGLPLAITSVQGASPVFRHSSVFPPLAWNGRTPRKMLGTPPANCQSGCLYPSCDFATPPFVPALEGEYARMTSTTIHVLPHITSSHHITSHYHIITSHCHITSHRHITSSQHI